MKERPTPPEDWECCESECSPCVWDDYYEAMREWNAEQKALKEDAEKAQSAPTKGAKNEQQP